MNISTVLLVLRMTKPKERQRQRQTDQDTEAEADTSVEADASRSPLTVDPFSAEEERIITVLSRKLEQVRFYISDFTPFLPGFSLFSYVHSDR
jgi:hypothetical protein